MRVHHLNCATMCPVSERLVNGRGSLFGPARMVCHCLLIESEAGLILVDTGLGNADIEQARARLSGLFLTVARPKLLHEETALAQVRRLGFRAEDVRHIILTHGDLDHAGGLSDFPEAEAHVFEDEHRAMTAPPATMHERLRYRRVQWSHGPKWVVHGVGSGERWQGFEFVRALPGVEPEVLIVPVPGHTRGHCAVAVQAQSRWLLHCGDAYFFHGQLDAERPWVPGGIGAFQWLADFDHELRKTNQERLRQLRMARSEIDVFCAHDPTEYERLLDRGRVISLSEARAVVNADPVAVG